MDLSSLICILLETGLHRRSHQHPADRGPDLHIPGSGSLVAGGDEGVGRGGTPDEALPPDSQPEEEGQLLRRRVLLRDYG